MDEESVFHLALEKPPGERAALLDEACQADAELRERVEQLLSAHDHPEGFILNSPPFGLDATAHRPISERPGSVIGPYKLLEQIGEGGMGVVFMAEQKEPFQRTVALKIIKPGMDTRQVIARFEAERQALAMMDHPNIARVMDAGATESGRPYFVMELVKGVPITEFCIARRLPLRERLNLFVTICRAIQHAHQKGIIHRDLKPSNVLAAPCDGQPVPKVIDFGVAKAAGPKLTERTLFTEFGLVLGTLEYMSPEQAELNQLDIDTRSDIYGLGVLLYELLTGTTPLRRERLRETSLVDILRVIREEEPLRPSACLTAKQQSPVFADGNIPSTEFRTQLRGELDWVVMKALEKDRNRRYPTANSLALDLERYLANEPVEAAPPSATYRLRKFAVRNKAAIVTAVLVAASLLAGTAISVWQASLAQSRLKSEQAARHKANVEAAKAKTISVLLKQMLSLANPSAAKGANYTVREMLDEFATGLGSRLRDQPDAEAAIRATIGNAYCGLQSFDKAEPHLKAALDARIRLFGPVHAEVAQSLVDYSANLYGRGSIVEAERRVREALSIHRQVSLDDSSAMRVLSSLQLYLVVQGKFKEANDIALEALEIAGRHPKMYPEEAIVLHNLAHAALHQWDPVNAEQLARRSVALHRILHGESHPETTHAQFVLAGSLHAQLKLDEAATCYRDVLAIQRSRFDDSQTPVLAACAGLADTLRAKGDQAGLSALRASIDLSTSQPDEWESWYFRGSFLAALSDWEQAGAAFAKAAERESDPAHARNLYYLSLARLANHDLPGYREACAKLIKCAERLKTPTSANLAAWACLLGPESVADPDLVIATVQQGFDSDPKDAARLAALGAAYYRAGRFDEASHILVEVIEGTSAESTDLRMVTYSQLFLAMAQQQLRRHKEAQDWLNRATQAIDHPASIAQRKLAENWDTSLALHLLQHEAAQMILNPERMK